MVEFWAIIKSNCECNCRYDFYKCIERSYILHSLCICNNFQRNLHMNVAKVDFYFIVIHTFLIGCQTSKLIITQTLLQWGKHSFCQLMTASMPTFIGRNITGIRPTHDCFCANLGHIMTAFMPTLGLTAWLLQCQLDTAPLPTLPY